MTIIQKISIYFKKKYNFLSKIEARSLSIKRFNPIIIFTFLIIFSSIFFISSNFINKKNQKNKDNLVEVTKSNEFSNFTNFLISKINSPYEEINYVIESNDTVEKILKRFKVRNTDIKKISLKLKEKKLANINTGRKLSLILKKLENGSNTIINFVYPINNTTSVEVRKSQNDFLIKENILQLYKKEVVVKNSIKNNLYSSAIEVGIEPNIIVEFARIFGFEVDFQRDIRKDDWFEILYEKFEDDNNKIRDTGKIIYASMYVNGEEINLYNFKYNNVEEFYDIKGKSITKSLMKTPINGAVSLAKKNAIIQKLQLRTKFFNKSFEKVFNKKFDLIVSNPPYIEAKDIKNLSDDIKKYEPRVALDGGNDGLDLIKKIIYKSKRILKINGTLALEIGNEQINKVSKILIDNKFRISCVIKDYRKNVRCVIAEYK